MSKKPNHYTSMEEIEEVNRLSDMIGMTLNDNEETFPNLKDVSDFINLKLDKIYIVAGKRLYSEYVQN